MIKGMIIIYFAQKNFKIAAQDYLAGCLPPRITSLRSVILERSAIQPKRAEPFELRSKVFLFSVRFQASLSGLKTKNPFCRWQKGFRCLVARPRIELGTS